MSDQSKKQMSEMPGMVAHDHQACVARVMDETTRLIGASGARLTPVRRRTLEILLESHRAMGAYDVLKRLDAEGFGAQPTVAYRALDFLVEHGLAHKIERLNAFVACMQPHEGHEPAFMICRSCRAVAETTTNNANSDIQAGADAIGFQVERTVMELEGLCPKCQDTSA